MDQLIVQEVNNAMGRSGLTTRLRALLLAQAATGAPAHEFLGQIAKNARQQGHPSREELTEVLLQAALFFGFPRAISGFRVLEAAWPAVPEEAASKDPDPAELDRRHRGGALFGKIYGKNDGSVRAMLRGFHQTFHDFVITEAYGRILARPGLPPVERELLAVAALAVQNQVPQLIAHGRGAATFGASADSIREAIWCGLKFTAAEPSAAEATADQLLNKIGPANR